MKIIERQDLAPTFKNNTIIQLRGKYYRIIGRNVNTDNDVTIWLIELETGAFKIISRSLRDLTADTDLIMCEEPEVDMVPVLEPLAQASAEYRHKIITTFITSLDNDYGLLMKRDDYSRNMWADLSRELNVTKKRARQLLRDYLQSGARMEAVMDKRLLRSVREDYDPLSGDVRGRKRNGKSSNVRNDDKLYAFYESVYNLWNQRKNAYLYSKKSRYKPTLMGAYSTILLKEYSFVNSKGEVELLPDADIPSFRRTYNWIRKHKLDGDLVRNQNVSAIAYRNDRRLLKGTSDYGIYQPLELVEIDENETSFNLRSRIFPGVSIGHAVTYYAVDVLTHRIVGASVSFANNSYEGFLNLVDSMIYSDEENASFFGVPYDAVNIFPGRVLPLGIRVDQGAEYVSKALMENLTGGSNQGTLEGIPVDINIVPVGSGSFKGLVERSFGEVHRRIQNGSGLSMGYVNDTVRSPHDKEATVFIEDFRRIIYELIKLHNNSPITSYPVTPEIVETLGDNITPNTLWDYFLENRGISGYEINDNGIRNRVRYGLFKKDKVFRVSRRQISYRDTLYYDLGDDAILTAKAIRSGDKSEVIEIRYDPRAVDIVYRADVYGVHEYHLAEKRENMKAFRGWRWPELDVWITQENSRKYERTIKKSKMNTLTEGKISGIIQESKDALPEGKTTKKKRKEVAEMERAYLTIEDAEKRKEIFGTQQPSDINNIEQTTSCDVSEVTEITGDKNTIDITKTDGSSDSEITEKSETDNDNIDELDLTDSDVLYRLYYGKNKGKG